MAILAIENLEKSYGGRQVVKNVSMAVSSGQVIGLLGPNGAGKTTTFYMTVGMVRPDSGKVLLDGDDITYSPMYIRARKGIGYLPQEASVFRKLTVGQNVLAILETLPLSKEKQQTRAEALLEELGIRHLMDQKANLLSGGERRRLEICRALATNPSFILLDEPFAGIDPLAVADIKNIIGQLKQSHIGILISDHNVRETLETCDEAYILAGGEVIEAGAPHKIANSQIARQIYLGDEFRL
jgi:lipopolysaccharide export system ATP-binding protein